MLFHQRHCFWFLEISHQYWDINKLFFTSIDSFLFRKFHLWKSQCFSSILWLLTAPNETSKWKLKLIHTNFVHKTLENLKMYVEYYNFPVYDKLSKNHSHFIKHRLGVFIYLESWNHFTSIKSDQRQLLNPQLSPVITYFFFGNLFTHSFISLARFLTTFSNNFGGSLYENTWVPVSKENIFCDAENNDTKVSSLTLSFSRF